MGKYGLQYVVAGAQILKSSLNLVGQIANNKSGNAAIENEKATKEFFKSSFDVINGIDPTGIAGKFKNN